MKVLLKYGALFVFFTSINSLQAQTITIEQDSKFEQLLNEKRKVNASLTINDRWKIQIFTGKLPRNHIMILY
jgi:hypothetical protein